MLKSGKILTFNQVIRGIALVTLFNLLNGCYYYKVLVPQDPPEPTVLKLQDEAKFIILHYNDQAWHFSSITYEDSVISGDLTYLTGHTSYIRTNPASTHNRYKKTVKEVADGKYVNNAEVLNEVHVYVSDYTRLTDTRYSIPANSIYKIEIYDKAVRETVASWVFGGLAVTGGIVLAAIIISNPPSSGSSSSSSSGGCSCPSIKVFDGNEYKFIGDIFSGSIRPVLERDDFLALPAMNDKGKVYKLKMYNEDHEIQHINLAELIVVDHNKDQDVMIDKYGSLQTLKDIVTPFEAENVNGINILPLIETKDSLSYIGDTKPEGLNNEEIIMKFIKPANAVSSKLVIRARNTLWLEMLYANYHARIGEKYDEFSKRQETIPAKEQIEWALSQNFPLSLYMEKNGAWKFLDYFNIAGPKAFKDDILEINLDDIDSDTVKLKLGYGFLFWEIDYAGMDFTTNDPARVYKVPIKNATDEKDANLSELLNTADDKYYVQNEVGNESVLTFNLPEWSGDSRTVILHTKGYYHIQRELQGKPDRQFLRSFRKPGRFPSYSREMFDHLQANYN